MVNIADYLDPKLIKFFSSDSRNDVVRVLVDLLKEEKKIEDKKPLYQAIIQREKIVTTGIGMGVAIPHAKLPEYDKFFIAIGILSQGVEWEALDGNLVRLVFLIGGPDDKQTEYLQILSGITMALKDEEKRKKILTADSAEAVIKLFKG